MTKVYIIFEGEYSNKHIVKCFSTKEKAEAFKKKLIKEDKERRAREAHEAILKLNSPETFDEWKKERKIMGKKYWGFSQNVVIPCFNCRRGVVYDLSRDIVVNPPEHIGIDKKVSKSRIKKLLPHEPTCFEIWKDMLIEGERRWVEVDYEMYDLEYYDIE